MSAFKYLCHLLSGNVEKILFSERLKPVFIIRDQNDEDALNLITKNLESFYSYISFFDNLENIKNDKSCYKILIDYFYKEYMCKSFEILVFEYESEISDSSKCVSHIANYNVSKYNDFYTEYESIVSDCSVFMEETSRNYSSSFELAKLFLKYGDTDEAEHYIKQGVEISKVQCMMGGIIDGNKLVAKLEDKRRF